MSKAEQTERKQVTVLEKVSIQPEAQSSIKQTMQEHLETTKDSIKEWEEIRQRAQESVAHMQKRVEELERSKIEQEERVHQEKIQREQHEEQERRVREERDRIEKEQFARQAEKIKQDMLDKARNLLESAKQRVEELGEHFVESKNIIILN
jgi:hypothetical protein